MRKIIFCNIAWANKYDGSDTQFYNGGSFVKENNDGGEYRNFKKYNDGYLRGYVQATNHTIRPIQFGVQQETSRVEGVLVIWVATPNNESVRRVIGWFENATIYTKPIYDDFKGWFNIKAKSEDCVLLNLRDRYNSIKIPRSVNGGPGMGRSNTWFAKGEKNEQIVSEVIDFIEHYKSNGKTRKMSKYNTNKKIKNKSKKSKATHRRKSKCSGCSFNEQGWCSSSKSWCSHAKKYCKK